MIEKIKRFFSYFAAGLSLVLAALYALQRAKSNKLSDQLQQSELDNKDLPLKLEQARNEDLITESKKKLKELDKPVTVTDLSPKEVEDYWSKK